MLEMLSVNAVEATWGLTNAATLVVAVWLLVEARRDRDDVRMSNGRARTLATASNVHREWNRVAVSLLLVIVVIPSLFRPGDTPLTPQLGALMLVPLLLLADGIRELRARRVLDGLLADKALADLLLEKERAT